MKWCRRPILCLLLSVLCFVSCPTGGMPAARAESATGVPETASATSQAETNKTGRAYVLLVDMGFGLMGDPLTFVKKAGYKKLFPLSELGDPWRVSATVANVLIDSMEDGDWLVIASFDGTIEQSTSGMIGEKMRQQLKGWVGGTGFQRGQNSLPGASLKSAIDQYSKFQKKNRIDADAEYILISGGLHSFVTDGSKTKDNVDADAKDFADAVRTLGNHLHVVSLKPEIDGSKNVDSKNYKFVANSFRAGGGESGNFFECTSPEGLIAGMLSAYAKTKGLTLIDATGLKTGDRIIFAGVDKAALDEGYGYWFQSAVEVPAAQENNQKSAPPPNPGFLALTGYPKAVEPSPSPAVSPTAQAVTPAPQETPAPQPTPDAGQGAQESGTPDSLPTGPIHLDTFPLGNRTFEFVRPAAFRLATVAGDAVSVGVSPDGATVLLAAKHEGHSTLTFAADATGVSENVDIEVSAASLKIVLIAGIAVFCLLTAQILLVILMLRARRRRPS